MAEKRYDFAQAEDERINFSGLPNQVFIRDGTDSGTYPLTGIKRAEIRHKDIAWVYRDGRLDPYVFDETETATADNIRYVNPFDNGNNPGRWVLYGNRTQSFITPDPVRMVNLLAGFDRFIVNSQATPVGFEDPNTGFSNLVTNGGFDNNLDGWTLDEGSGGGTITWNSGTILFTQGGTSAWMLAYQAITVEAGKLYRLRWNKVSGGYWCKICIGTSAPVEDTSYSGDILDKVNVATGAGEACFVPSSGGTVYVVLADAQTADSTSEWDDIDLSEVIPAYVGADSKAPDGWWKSSGLKIYVLEGSGSFSILKPHRVLKIVNDSASELILQFPSFTPREWNRLFEGRTVAWGCGVKASVGKVRLKIETDVQSAYSGYNSSDEQWLEVSLAVPTGLTYFDLQVRVQAGATAEICMPMLTYGSYIGEGNYVPGHGWITVEKTVPLKSFHEISGFGDDNEWYYILPETFGKVGSEAKRVMVRLACRDSGSSSADAFAGLGYLLYEDLGAVTGEGIVRLQGVPNDVYRESTIQTTLRDGRIYVWTRASGVETLDIGFCVIIAVEV